MKHLALSTLIGLLATSSTAKRWDEVSALAVAIVPAFSKDPQLNEQAMIALIKTLDAATIDMIYPASMEAVPAALATGFGRDPARKQAALTALAKALGIASMARKEAGSVPAYSRYDRISRWRVDHATTGLKKAIAGGFAGDPKAAALLLKYGDSELLATEGWRQFVVLLGRELTLIELAGLHGERWGAKSKKPIICMIDPAASVEADRAVLVAPREFIRRGLDPALLVDYFHESDDLASLIQKLRDMRTAEFQHAADFLAALCYLEVDDPADKVDQAMGKNKLTSGKLRKKLQDIAKTRPDHFPYNTDKPVPEESTLAKARALLTNPKALRFGPQTQSRLAQLIEQLNLDVRPNWK